MTITINPSDAQTDGCAVTYTSQSTESESYHWVDYYLTPTAANGWSFVKYVATEHYNDGLPDYTYETTTGVFVETVWSRYGSQDITSVSVVAHFERVTHRVTARATRATWPVTARVGDNAEGNPSTGIYRYGSTVQVSARSLSSDFVFTRWNDGNRQNPRTITVTSDITLTARFMRYPASNLLVNSYSRTSGQLVSDPVSGKLVVDYAPGPS